MPSRRDHGQRPPPNSHANHIGYHLWMNKKSMLMFPEKIYYRDADAIYQYIQQYSRKASSFPSDRLLDLEGAFSSYRRDVPRYLYHFYGISIPVYISRDNDQSESRELLSVYSSGFSLSSTFSFLTGLAWTYNLKSRGQSNRLTT